MGTETDGRPEVDALGVFDQAHAQAVELRALDDRALQAETHLADLDVIVEAGRLDDLRKKIATTRAAYGPSAVDKLLGDELAQAQRVNLANLRLVEAQAERQRRQEERQAQAERQAQQDRAAQLAELRRSAWQQYQRDAGHQIDGVSLADEAVFDARWNAYLVDLSLGRATLPGG